MATLSTHARTPLGVVAPLCAAAITVLATVAVPALAQADGGCIPGDKAGQVPRNARPGDMVCVSQTISDLVQQENATAAQRREPNGGAYGPLTCLQGYVWREAFDGDGVCVSPKRRQETWAENAAAGVGPTGGITPPATTGNSSADPALLQAVNDARLHPEKYPPNGNSSGAKMTGCANALQNSAALTNAAVAHTNYIATLPGSGPDGVNEDNNMHKNPGGKLSWADGGPIAQAGYNSWRAEIVATGQGSEAGAVEFWMQNDANWGWGHRNAILRCETTDAGAAHLAGGPVGNYWTVDLGTP